MVIGGIDMDKYREQLLEKIEELKNEFETVKSEMVKDITNATPNKVTSMVSSYSGGVSELCVIAGKINALQEQLRALDYYSKDN